MENLKLLDEIKDSNPELYNKLMEVAVGLNAMSRRERRKAMREMTKQIDKSKQK